MMFNYFFGIALLMTLFGTLVNEADAGEPLASDVVLRTDVPYAKVGDHQLVLDLYVPQGRDKKPPLVVYVHGGGWRTGTHRGGLLTTVLANRGYAVASIGYRLSDQAKFPAQIHDCKGAVRWLRAHAEDYGYDASRIAAMGSSAGGHLILLLGTTTAHPELEGDVGGNLEQSSAVQCLIDFYGPADFILRTKDQQHTTDHPDGSVHRLLGKPVTGNEEWAKLASPAWHVTQDDPPLLIVHGDKDRVVLLNQSERMRNAYQTLGLPVELQIIPGGEHGGPKFLTPQVRESILRFLATHFTPGAQAKPK